MSAHRWSCLMYHEVDPGTASGYFAVTREQFGEQLDRLLALGMRGVSMEELVRGAAGVTASGRRAPQVAITFDDGHRTHYEHALPELVARGMTATFFVITSRVGTGDYATWDQLREMAAAGMSIQSHTDTHPFLSELSREAASRELRESKRRIDAELRQDTVTVALPGGDRPRGWRAEDYRALGYRWVATSRWGPNADAGTFVRRYTIRRDTPPATFDDLALGRPSPRSKEGVRLWVLGEVRSLLGPSRYARLRRSVLSAIGR